MGRGPSPFPPKPGPAGTARGRGAMGPWIPMGPGLLTSIGTCPTGPPPSGIWPYREPRNPPPISPAPIGEGPMGPGPIPPYPGAPPKSLMRPIPCCPSAATMTTRQDKDKKTLKSSIFHGFTFYNVFK